MDIPATPGPGTTHRSLTVESDRFYGLFQDNTSYNVHSIHHIYLSYFAICATIHVYTSYNTPIGWQTHGVLLSSHRADAVAGKIPSFQVFHSFSSPQLHPSPWKPIFDAGIPEVMSRSLKTQRVGVTVSPWENFTHIVWCQKNNSSQVGKIYCITPVLCDEIRKILLKDFLFWVQNLVCNLSFEWPIKLDIQQAPESTAENRLKNPKNLVVFLVNVSSFPRKNGGFAGYPPVN